MDLREEHALFRTGHLADSGTEVFTLQGEWRTALLPAVAPV